MKKGFTLIELLVVVLIIGILAAVALPQYQTAVEKSRATEALIMIKNAQQVQILEYLKNPNAAEDGNFEDPQDLLEWSNGTWQDPWTFCTKHFKYMFNLADIDAWRVNSCEDNNYLYDLQIETPFFGENWETEKICYAKSDIGYKVCQSLVAQGFELEDNR